MNIEQIYQVYLSCRTVQTDTRKLQSGDLFVALKGPNFNGNLFALQALEQGAAWAIVDELPTSDTSPASARLSDRLILVADALATLQELALHHRKQFSIPFIAITGSNGKTTTKELVHTVLSSKYIIYTTQGNLNNHIGVPLTILSVKSDAQFAVIEMGANHQKEIESYCRYTLPTHGIITNAGKAHLEGFGGPEGVKKGKGELYDFLRTHDGTAFVMWDYDYLREMSRGIPHIITYGTQDASLTGIAIHPGVGLTLPAGATPPAAGDQSFLSVQITSDKTTGTIHTQLVGDYNLPNVLVAVTVGKQFGVPDAQIREAIEHYAPSNSRSQLLEKDGNHIILDAYNANPSSMRAAIENFARLALPAGSAQASPNQPGAAPNKVLILGAMAELGPDSLDEHRQIAGLIAEYPWLSVALVGGDFQRLDHPFHRFDNAREAGQWLKQANYRNVWLLVKGSRSMRMEEVLQ